MKTKERAKKVSRGEYVYRGYCIHNCGYYDPEHSVIWEAYEIETGDGIAWASTKKGVMLQLDHLEKEMMK